MHGFRCKSTRLLFIFVGFLYAANSIASIDSDDYIKAYKACSPLAESATRQQCNYGVVFEKFYLQCMKKYGYGDSDADKFDGYVKAYKYCSSEADSGTRGNCNYGNLYQQKYNQCLRKYGFNESGEKIAGDEPHFRFDF